MAHEIKKRNLFQIINQTARELGYRNVAIYSISVVLLIVICVTFALSQTRQNLVQDAAGGDWAFEDTFSYGAPSSPSQSLLPKSFDYAVTHRTHPAETDGASAKPFPADHDEDCTFDGTNAKQHDVTSTHLSSGNNPDMTFYVCNNHMMSSMGDIEGYSISTFWPRQEFNFANGGVLEWDVNLNVQSRNWYEVVIIPRNQFRVAPAIASLPIDEVYPKDRIVIRYGSPAGGERFMAVSDQMPSGSNDNDRNATNEWQSWRNEYPNDPANTDRRIRRKNKLTIENNRLTWGIQRQDGTFDDVILQVPEGIPFNQGLVQFKTHAYTPNKDEVHQRHTFHWDNIRFSGPVLPPYQSFEYTPIVNLSGNGSRPIGTTQTISMSLPRVGVNPVLFGQVQQPRIGQVLLSINGSPNISMSDFMHLNENNCSASGWTTFWAPIDPSLLREGENTFRWTIGPRPSCLASWAWDGFSVKGFEVQFDSASTGGENPTFTPQPTIIAPTNTLPSPSASPTSQLLPTPTLIPSPTLTRIPTPTSITLTPASATTPTSIPTATVAPSATPTRTPSQRADFNNSGTVDIQDLSYLLTRWGSSDNVADVNGDGSVSVLDLSIVLSNWGQ